MRENGGNRMKPRAAAILLGAALSVSLAAAVAPRALADSSGSSNPATAATISGLEASTGACPSGGPVPIPCPPEGAAKSLKTTDQLILKPLVEGGLMFIMLDYLTYVTDRLAYEAAIALSSGGKGQQPLVHLFDPLDSGNNPIGLDIVGEGLAALGDVTQQTFSINFNVCKPAFPELLLNLQLGIKQAYQPVPPRCDFMEVGRNWQSFVAAVNERFAASPDRATEAVLQEFAKSLRPGQNELDASMAIAFSTREEYNFRRNWDLQQMLAEGGFKPLTDMVTGQIKTPASVLREQYNQDTIEDPAKKKERMFDVIANNPEFGLAFLGHSLSVFTNTLSSELLKKVYEGFFSPAAPASDPFNALATPQDAREQAIARFAGIITAQPTQVSNYNALAEFVTCPSGGSAVRNINNCVMDQNFAQAVTRASGDMPLTVQQAIDDGLLDPAKPLIPPTDEAKNQDPFCYSYGYCYGNLVKLRKARILPIGWEIAAKLNTSSSPATLQDVIYGFDDCDTGGKWCHLIDPNWVLKYPETQCKAFANGEILATSASSARAGYCADAPSCIAEDANGNCKGGFGYCVREKNTWKFKGDACPAEFASCLAFTNRQTGVKGGFLLNTVDFDGCNAGNAGCTWYQTVKARDATTGAFAFLPAGTAYDVAAHDAAADEYKNRVYFTNDVKQCSPTDAGCSALFRAEGLTLNMVRNGSFETDGVPGTGNTPDGLPDGWTNLDASRYATSGDAFSGSDSVRVGTGSSARARQEGIYLTKDSFYTLSAQAKSAAAGRTASATLVFMDAATGTPLDLGGTATRAFGDTCALDASNVVKATSGTLGTDFARFGCTFSVPGNALVRLDLAGSDDVTVDAVQIERGENATDFVEVYSSNTAAFAANLKVPPSYLGCRGLATDPTECKRYAAVCSAVDVGCELYTPQDGDPNIPAVASDIDRCPAECVGYAAFKQEPTRYEATRFPVNFIPTTADSCSAADVGCDAFTNLDTVAAGGEGVEHYVNLRACVTPTMAGADSATFFTWVGTESSGFQLKTWQLLESNASGADGDAPCTTPSMGSATTLACADAADFVEPDDCDLHDDTITNLYCGEYYDGNGVIHYRDISKVVFVDASCHPYRKTDGAPDTLSARTDDCVAGGFLEPNGSCRYFGLPDESQACPASAAGCRAYTGGAGNNLATILDETFEDSAVGTTRWSAVASTIAISSDAVSAGGHSLRVTDASAGEGVATVGDASSPLKGKIVSGRTFMIEFFARGSADIAVSLRTAAGAAVPVTPIPVDLTTGWVPYSVGPIDTASVSGFDDNATLQFLVSGGGSEFFLDNVRVKMADDTLALVKDSWATPSTCDTAPNGASAPQFYLGCEAYKDRKGATQEFYRFGRLCSEQVVGCQAFYDTRGSESSYGQTFNATCENTALPNTLRACVVGGKTVCQVPPGQTTCLFTFDGTLPTPLPSNVELGPSARIIFNDAPVYLVETPGASCSAAAVGCTEVGLPKFNQTKTAVDSFSSLFLVDDPDSYNLTLCGHEALFCQEFASTKDGTFYFKDPLDQTCEFKDEVEINGEKFSGWFRKGTKDPCEPTLIEGGEEFLLPLNGDPAYDGWYGSCETRYDLCTEFRDPSDTQNGRVPQGASYFFLNNNALATRAAGIESCDGRVSQKQGCALFFNSSLTNVTSSSAPTYTASNHADQLFGETQFALVDPINCNIQGGGVIDPPGAAPSVNLCASRCEYAVGSENLTVGNSTRDDAAGLEYFGSCLVDDDCPDLVATDDQLYEGTCVDLTARPTTLWNRNDTNTVLQVGNDRQCSEWLACSSSQVSWDPNAGRWREICDQVSLCTAFDATADESFCASFDSSEPIKLTAGVYQSRDVTWSGREYSGYAIPDALPVDLYDQVNIRPDRWCVDDGVVVGLGATQDGDNPDAISPPPDSHGFGLRCSTTADCSEGSCQDATPEVRLAFVAGTCDEDDTGFGGDCRVGYCRETGTACSLDSECEGGTGDDCVFGFCQATSGTAFCDSREDADRDGFDDDCEGNGAFRYCDTSQGRCVTMLEDELDTATFTDCSTSCSGAAVCVQPTRVRDGSCLNDQCVTNFQGAPLEVPEDSEPLSCRGYPEPDSPFKPSVIPLYTPNFETTNPYDMPRPANASPAFQQAHTCAPVYIDGKWVETEECLCSYDKIVYGENVVTAYTEIGTFSDRTFRARSECDGGPQDGKACVNDNDCPDTPGENDADCDANSAGSQALNTGVPKMVCSTGTRAGEPCQVDFDCGASAQCIEVRSRNTVYGYEGYCLEDDTSIQLFNDPSVESRACLTWFPVEQLSGSTNLFAKFATAGFSEDAYYCADTEVYYNLKTSKIGGLGTMACAEKTEGGNSDQLTASNSCFKTVYCPKEYFAVMAPMGVSDADGGADADVGHFYCDEFELASDGDDCPYFCVPKDSRKADVSCDVPNVANQVFKHVTEDGGGDNINSVLDSRGVVWENAHILEIDFDAYLVPRVKFQEFVNNATYNDCVAKGFTHEQLGEERLLQGDWIDDGISEEFVTTVYPGRRADSDFYGNLFITAEPYIGCERIAQVSQANLPPEDEAVLSPSNLNFAWSDRTWVEKEPPAYTVKPFDNGLVVFDDPDIQPNTITEIQPFGQALEPLEFVDDGGSNPYPEFIAQCVHEDTVLVQDFGVQGFNIPTWTIRVMPWDAEECPTDYERSAGADAGLDSRAFNRSAYAGRGTLFHPTQGPGIAFDCTSDEALNVGDVDKCHAQVSCSGGTCINGPLAGESCSSSAQCRAALDCVSSGDLGDADSGLASGSDFVCITTAERFYGGQGIVESVTRLQQFFARTLGLFTWSPDSDPRDATYDGPSNTLPSGVIWDTTATGDKGVAGPEDPTPPIVRAVGDCVGTLCEEGDEDAFSVNGLSGGVVSGSERKHVTASFYMYADEDQLPIRTAVVDWGASRDYSGQEWDTGTQSGSQTNNNFYKNHRGLKPNGSGPICSDTADDAEHRGLFGEACESSYVTFTHDYICSQPFVTQLEEDGRSCDVEGGALQNSPCTGGEVPDAIGKCVFQPRVFVKDNWGWCTGVCTGNDFGDGASNSSCFQGECDTRFPDANFGPDNDPWVYFNGFVVVEP
ncbi:hypothetical protein A2856_00175 [Candidatus Uhrbacteria bacterium RIFCSPHIGHO2_01_FULL_63_20]|uniref:CBM-cenC domain-containing protein n=1 Tax=Candidatus Uhrbacteria bacterium RIFCSPHIGHO2_01_FULL_63_20 TaxID=1802385 RepID=A0A1F7TLR2_9BACT|nr:MAG: hypothetical protein A2856_00175 [Candidatus Uhrbacteria bacterium RIFCSPHIGHO2_01_FULL_63_20]